MTTTLADRLMQLEDDLMAEPMRSYTYRSLPFAVFCYRPEDEWALRREAALLRTRLERAGRFRVHRVSLAQLLWQAVDESESMAELTGLERSMGFAAAQDQVAVYLSEAEWRPLPDLLEQAIKDASPDPDGRKKLVFIERAGALAPAIYRASVLLDKMVGRVTDPCVLFLPATGDEYGISFMGVAENEARGSYHTKVYIDH